MIQSTLLEESEIHVALIMDGNGRWATRRGLPRTAGHHVGISTVRRVVEAAPGLDIAVLTLFAFSADNWRRPAIEVETLMRLMQTFIHAETNALIENGVRLTVIGRRDRLPDSLVRHIAEAEQMTAPGQRLHLRIAFDYSSREAIASAAARWHPALPPSSAEFGGLVAQDPREERAATVDLLIRTGGEKRLSDFLLWECAYAELHFTDVMWPDFGAEELCAAITEFRGRERRFGGLGSRPTTAEDTRNATVVNAMNI